MLSRAQSEIYKSELDELLKNLLEEILTDSYAVEKIVNFQESSKRQNLCLIQLTSAGIC